MRTGSICGISKHMQQAADIEESGGSLSAALTCSFFRNLRKGLSILGTYIYPLSPLPSVLHLHVSGMAVFKIYSPGNLVVKILHGPSSGQALLFTKMALSVILFGHFYSLIWESFPI